MKTALKNLILAYAALSSQMCKDPMKCEAYVSALDALNKS